MHTSSEPLDPNRPPVMPKRPTRDGIPTLREAGRVWWMLTWRFFLVAAVSSVSASFALFAAVCLNVVGAFALVHGARLTFNRRPVLGLLKGQAPLRQLYDTSTRLRTGHPGRASAKKHPSRVPTKPTIERASKPGVMTGFEPHHLKNLAIPSGPLVFGNPGAGLSDSGFDAGAIKSGQAGEVNFAKVLGKEGLAERFATFWSVGMPDEYGRRDPKYANVDIDAVVVTGSTIWLVDLKNYRQGDVIYRVFGEKLFVEDVETGSWVGQPYKMSRNMSNAQMRFETAYGSKGYTVRSRVVLMPTGNGMGKLDNVSWPGGVPASSLPEFLGSIRNQPAYEPSARQDEVKRSIKRLLK